MLRPSTPPQAGRGAVADGEVAAAADDGATTAAAAAAASPPPTDALGFAEFKEALARVALYAAEQPGSSTYFPLSFEAKLRAFLAVLHYVENSNQRPIRPLACPASARSSSGRPQASASLGQPRPIGRMMRSGWPAILGLISTKVLLASPGVNDEANSLQSAWRVERSPARLLAEDVLRAAVPRPGTHVRKVPELVH